MQRTAATLVSWRRRIPGSRGAAFSALCIKIFPTICADHVLFLDGQSLSGEVSIPGYQHRHEDESR